MNLKLYYIKNLNEYMFRIKNFFSLNFIYNVSYNFEQNNVRQVNILFIILFL